MWIIQMSVDLLRLCCVSCSLCVATCFLFLCRSPVVVKRETSRWPVHHLSCQKLDAILFALTTMYHHHVIISISIIFLCKVIHNIMLYIFTIFHSSYSQFPLFYFYYYIINMLKATMKWTATYSTMAPRQSCPPSNQKLRESHLHWTTVCQAQELTLHIRPLHL